ncbi:MAG: alcohol dehydrogenase family protein [Pseudomonadota bacterium]
MTLPETMRAVVLTGHGDLDKLVYQTDWPTPKPGAGEVLIRVGACGMNNTDVNTRTAWYSKGTTEATTGGSLEGIEEDDATWGGASITFPRIQGADIAGMVVAVGSGADETLIGCRVLIDTWLRNWDDPLDLDQAGYLGSEADGGYAEFTKIDQRHVHPIQCDLTNAELATFATAYVTAENMLNRAAVGADDVVLIPGASGGVGSALIQLANRRGARTVAMCGTDKADAVREVGPEAVLPRSPESLKSALRDAIGRDSVTVVADVVGGALWPQMIDVVSRGGRYTCAGAIAGPVVEFDLRTFYLRDLTFTGATVVPPGTFADLVGYIERGEIRPLLAETYRLEDFHAAQTAFIGKRHIGNIVVTLD